MMPETHINHTNKNTTEDIDGFFFFLINQNSSNSEKNILQESPEIQQSQTKILKPIPEESFQATPPSGARRISAAKKKYGQVLNLFARYFLSNRSAWLPFPLHEEAALFLKRFVGSTANSEYTAETLKKISEIMNSTSIENLFEFDSNFKNFFHSNQYEYCINEVFKGNEASKCYLLKNKMAIFKKIRSQYQSILELD